MSKKPEKKHTRAKKAQPSMTLHKASGLARVTLNGTTIYLGKWNSPEAQTRYNELLAEWHRHGRQLPPPPEELTLAELCLAFHTWAEAKYTSAQLDPLEAAIALAVEHLGGLRVSELGPKRFMRYQETLTREYCRSGDRTHRLARSTANRYASILRRIIGWGVTEELVPPSVHHGLRAVPALRKNLREVRETERVKPVPEADRRAVLLHAPKVLRDMIRVASFTGCRPSELCGLRRCDLDTRGAVWIATLKAHKLAWRENSEPRIIAFGKRCQRILRPYLLRGHEQYLFSPRECMQQRAAACRTHRRKGQKPTPTKTDREVSDCYTAASFRRAIHRICEELHIPKWSPNQLRHLCASRVRAKYGLDASQVVLGHSKADTTEVYAEVRTDRLVEIMERMG